MGHQGTGRTIKVLLAEDNVRLGDELVARLQRTGVEVTRVYDGIEALDAFDEIAYDIIVTDNHMPGGPPGIEVAKQIRMRRTSVPIIIFSTSERYEFGEDLAKHDLGYIQKQPDELEAEVDRLVEKMTDVA